jgi:hypothetical protein
MISSLVRPFLARNDSGSKISDVSGLGESAVGDPYRALRAREKMSQFGFFNQMALASFRFGFRSMISIDQSTGEPQRRSLRLEIENVCNALGIENSERVAVRILRQMSGSAGGRRIR